MPTIRLDHRDTLPMARRRLYAAAARPRVATIDLIFHGFGLDRRQHLISTLPAGWTITGQTATRVTLTRTSPARGRGAQTPTGAGQWIDVTTLNDAFQTPGSNLTTALTLTPGSIGAVIIAQETNHERINKIIPAGWDTYQNADNKAGRSNTALAWTGQITAAGRALQHQAVAPNKWTNGRWITAQPTVINGRQITLITAHRPPKRARALWPIFDAAFIAFVRQQTNAGRLVIAGMDANQKNPTQLARLAGLELVTRPGSIDVLMVSPQLHAGPARRLAKGNSDHQPLTAQIFIPDN